MPGKTRKFAALSPVKQRQQQNPAKFVRLSDHDEDSERRALQAEKRHVQEERTRALIAQSNGSGGTPQRNGGGVTKDVIGETMSPMPKLPILANFEEWMKLATDNKINAGNSWNFALIDYFHEMSLLREGDSINFQKASVTLDGCVKIYTNRVDSVATETGKLLSGLSSSKQGAADGADGEDGENDGEGDEDEDEEKSKKATRRKKTNAGSTLAKDFSALQVKKLEVEFFVDPLFKKTSAEFDEGGAKGLLLNHLSVDDEGRIIFDASDAVNDASASTSADAEDAEDDRDEDDIRRDQANIEALGQKFFPELFGPEVEQEPLSDLHICPSLLGFKTDSAVLDIPALSAMAHLSDDRTNALDDDDFDDAGSGSGSSGSVPLIDVFDSNESPEFGQVDDFEMPLAHNAPAAAPDMLLHAADAVGAGSMAMVDLADGRRNAAMDDLYAHFDVMLRKNWAGPANWKINRVNAHLNAAAGGGAGALDADGRPIAKKPRVAREKHLIDFLSAEGAAAADSAELFKKKGTAVQLNLPKNQWKSKTRNLLPEDKHFSSEQLLRLFLKPKARVRAVGLAGPSSSSSAGARAEDGDGDRFVQMDENFWAKEQAAAMGAHGSNGAAAGTGADFYHDNDGGLDLGTGAALDDEDDDGAGGVGGSFHDAAESFEPASTQGTDYDPTSTASQPASQFGTAGGDFGSQLQQLGRRGKPEYVNFARTAKKVDVRVLKENLWKKLDFDVFSPPRKSTTDAPAGGAEDGAGGDGDTSHSSEATVVPDGTAAEAKLEPGERKFTEVVTSLRDVYPASKLGEISTSFCFICLLHLANEQGLEIRQADDGRLSTDETAAGEEDGLKAVTRGMQDLVVRRDPNVPARAVPAA